MPDDVSPGPSTLPARSRSLGKGVGAPGARAGLVLGLATVVVSVSVVLGVRPVSDPGLWLRLRVGAFLLDGRRFSLPDPWAPFATRTYVPTEWLPSVIAQEFYRAFGLPGIAWLRSAAILFLLSALVWSARRSANAIIVLLVCLAAICLIALAGPYDGVTELPQLVGLLFLAGTVGAWWRTALDLRPRWWLVPMTWLWACCQGLWIMGILVGLVCIVGLLLDRRLTRAKATELFAIPLLSLVAAGLTPLGPQLVLHPLAVAGRVSGWQSPSVRDPIAVLTLAMLGLVLLSWFRLGRRPPWWQIGLLLTGVTATLASTRTVPVGAVIATPLLAQEIQLYGGQAVRAATRRSRPVWAALIAVALVAAVPLAAARAQDPLAVPTRLSPQLSRIPAGTVVLAEGNISGWLLWAGPGARPVLDPRIEIYPPEHLRAFVSAMHVGPGWKQFLDRAGTRYALVREGSPIATALTERAGWSQLGRDAGFVLLRAR